MQSQQLLNSRRLWTILTIAFSLIPAVIWPGDTFWIFDEPAEVAIAWRANQAGTLADRGLSGNFYLHYGPLPMQIYQAMLLFSHDPRVLVVLRATLCSLMLAGSLVWLSRSLRLTPWFAAAVVLAPPLWLNNRILWAANFAIPFSILAMAAYAAFLRSGGGRSLATALGAALALLCIHPQAAPLSTVIIGHMLWRHHRAMWRHRAGIMAVLAVLTLFNYRYLHYAIPTVYRSLTWYARTGYPEKMSNLSRGQAMLDPFMGGRLFGGRDFQKTHQRTPGPAKPLSAVALFSDVCIPLAWIGLSIAVVRQVRRRRRANDIDPNSEPVDKPRDECDAARQTLLALALMGFFLQMLYFGLLKVPPEPQYFFGTFGLHVFLSWMGVEAIKPLLLRGVIVGAYGLTLGILTLGSLWGVHHDGWPRTASPTLNEQISVVRELNRYDDHSVMTNVVPYLYDEAHALRVLRLLFPPAVPPSMHSGRLVIRYKAASGRRAGQIELIEARDDADIPPDARQVLLDYPHRR